jgi:hypothetical protein
VEEFKDEGVLSDLPERRVKWKCFDAQSPKGVCWDLIVEKILGDVERELRERHPTECDEPLGGEDRKVNRDVETTVGG